jgi:septum formation protein
VTLFLVSQSPRRAEILKRHQIPFQLAPNKLEAETPPTPPYKEWIVNLAIAKVNASKEGLSGLVLGSDTAVIIDNDVLGKPRDIAEAIDMLTHLSGRDHIVLSSYALLNASTGTWHCGVEENIVHFPTYSQHTAQKITQECQVLDKAGAYGIQDLDPYIKATIKKGNIESIMGLPIESLLPILSTTA